MSTITIIVLFSLLLIFGLLVIACLFRRKDMQALEQNPQTVTGTVVSCKELRSKDDLYQRVTICYTVDGTEYTQAFSCRPNKYVLDQPVTIYYVENKPKFARLSAVFHGEPQREFILLLSALAAFYCILVLIVLSNEYSILKRICGELQYLLWLFLILWVNFTERKLVRRGVPAAGTIVYAERDHKIMRVIAEYTVDGRTYETRQMKLPVKKCSREYCIGGQIGVRYQQKHPVDGIIEDDVMKLKMLRIITVICCFFIIAAVAFDVIIDLLK